MAFVAYSISLAPVVLAYARGDWIPGRATYFDAPAEWKAKFSQQIFGDLYGNACGYVNKGAGFESNTNFPFDRAAVAAVADFDADIYEGSCGSCYEVRCLSGRVKANDGGWFEYDVKRGFYETDPNATDTFGRQLAKRGAVLDANGTLVEYARCWNENATIKVRIIDTCPCDYITGKQEICCGPVMHFDLSYWAYERLAHPLQGKMNIEFRPIRCEDGEPTDASLGAANRVDRTIYTGSRTIYGEGSVIGAGWAWLPYKDKWLVVERPGYGRNGSAATCVNVDPGGRIAFTCWSCERKAKPFDAVYISFWLRISCTAQFNVPIYVGISARANKKYGQNGAVVTNETETQIGVKRLLDVNFYDSRTLDDNCGRMVVIPTEDLAPRNESRAANTLSIELASASDPAWARAGESPRPATTCLDDVQLIR